MDATEPDGGTTEATDRIRDDEIDEWLWDREDRHDVGSADDTVAHPLNPAPGDGRLAEIKRYRRPHGPVAPRPGRDDGDPTAAVAAADEEFFRPRYHPPAVKPRRRSRWVGVCALLIFVVLGVLVVAAALHQPHGSGDDLAVATPTTAPALVGPPAVSVTAPATGETTPATVAVTPPATAANTADAGSTPPVNPNVFLPVTAPSRTTAPATAHTTKATTATTTPPRTTTPPVSTPPVTSPPTTPPATTPPKPPPATTVPTLPPPTTTPATTPSTVPFGG